MNRLSEKLLNTSFTMGSNNKQTTYNVLVCPAGKNKPRSLQVTLTLFTANTPDDDATHDAASKAHEQVTTFNFLQRPISGSSHQRETEGNFFGCF